MGRRLPRWVHFLWSVLLCLPLLAVADEAQDKQQRLEQLRQRIQSLQQALRGTTSSRDRQLERLRQTERQIGRLTAELHRIEGQLADKQSALKHLQQQAAGQQRQLTAQQQALAAQLRAAYLMGRQERLKILLNQQDPATVSRMLIYYDYLNRSRLDRMQQIEQAIGALRQTRSRIESEQRELIALQRSQQQRIDALRTANAEREQAVAALNRRIRSQDQQIGQLKQDARQLKALISRLQEALADLSMEAPTAQKFSAMKGRLPWPSAGHLKHLFGTTKRGDLTWDGVIISAREGQPVRAVSHGRVAYADWLRGFGLLLIIDHGDGYMTLYGHNQSLFKEVGDWVEAGEPVGLVGNSGGLARAGVYFGIRYNGRPVNPKRWCSKPRRGRVRSFG